MYKIILDILISILLFYYGVREFREAYLFEKDPERFTDGLRKIDKYTVAIGCMSLAVLILFDKEYLVDIILSLMKKIGY